MDDVSTNMSRLTALDEAFQAVANHCKAMQGVFGNKRLFKICGNLCPSVAHSGDNVNVKT